METKLRSVGTIGVGFIFPEEILTQTNLKVRDICAFASVDNGIKLMIYGLESGHLKTAHQQDEIEYVSVISHIGSIGIGTSISQELLQRFDLQIGDVVPLVKMGDCLQLMATRKPKAPRKLILKDKTPEEKRAEKRKEESWRKPAGWWLRDDDRWMQ
ncbi:hypothetical protein Lepto7376_1838 [[Leptolyngbya] sp. PCC 7376]|nr:hypothetical protein Lepto7376_1838 [[Leptolyngbya] sp. PCC 7376]